MLRFFKCRHGLNTQFVPGEWASLKKGGSIAGNLAQLSLPSSWRTFSWVCPTRAACRRCGPSVLASKPQQPNVVSAQKGMLEQCAKTSFSSDAGTDERAVCCWSLQSGKARVLQVSVGRPLGDLNLGDEHGFTPSAVFHFLSR
jgi:hypothetical protein